LIEPLYTDEVINPHKQNIFALTAACLVRKGVAPKGYTGEQYEIDSNSQAGGHFPFNPDNPKISDKFQACMEAPAN
jgi:hypothetical protein